MEVQKNWYETLPDQCPPREAFTPQDFICYRLRLGDKVTCKDFHSHRYLSPHKKFHTTECIASSVSVFQDKSDLSNILKLAVHRGKKIAQITLYPYDGLALKTGNRTHYSWWRSDKFDINNAVEVVT